MTYFRRTGPPTTSKPASHTVVTQLAMGAYRQAFLDALQASGASIEFLVGHEHLDGTLQTAVHSPLVSVADRNVFSRSRRFAFQKGVTLRAVRANVTVVEFNPRIVTSWTILAARRALHRPSLVWGHAWSRTGPSSRTEPLRRAMRFLASGTIVYTASDAASLRARYPGAKVHIAPNSLYPTASIGAVDGTQRHIVYCGRLVPSKKVIDVVQAFGRLRAAGVDVDALHIVGDGPERKRLEETAASFGLGENIVFHGTITSPKELRVIYRDAVCAVSPGYVGLSATQSLGNGLPLVYAADEPHAPEAALLAPTNSVAYRGRPEGLAAALTEVVRERQMWRSRGKAIAAAVAADYSAEAMASSFLAATQGDEVRS